MCTSDSIYPLNCQTQRPLAAGHYYKPEHAHIEIPVSHIVQEGLLSSWNTYRPKSLALSQSMLHAADQVMVWAGTPKSTPLWLHAAPWLLTQSA